MKIKLTESKLKQIVTESVKKVLNESFWPEDIYGSDAHSWDPAEDEYYSKKEYNNMLTTLAQEIESGECDEWLADKEWLEELPEELMGNVKARRMMIDPDYALQNNTDSLEQFQKRQGKRPYVWDSSDKRWHNKKNSSYNFSPLLKAAKSKDAKKLDDVDWALVHDNAELHSFNKRLNGSQFNKKMYGGRNPEGEKLHTRGSANRDLMAIDRQRKTANN